MTPNLTTAQGGTPKIQIRKSKMYRSSKTNNDASLCGFGNYTTCLYLQRLIENAALKKLPLLITIVVVALIAGGYFLYDRFQKNPLSAWELVPSDAVLVYEKESCGSCIDEVTKSSVWKVIEDAAFYGKAMDSIRLRITKALREKSGVLVSAHVTKRDDFDFVFYVPSSSDFISLNDGALGKSHSRRSRAFSGVTIQEIHLGKQLFSFANIEGVAVGSFTPFLLEDVIRSYRNNERSGKRAVFGSFQFSSVKDDAGNLYVRIAALHDFLSVFVDDLLVNYSFGKSALLDIKANENTLTLNGFSTDSIEAATYLLSVFRHQNPVSFGLKNLISNRVAAVSSYGISDGKNFGVDLDRFIKTKRPKLRDSLNMLSTKYSLDIKNLYSKISDEVAICYMESPKQTRFSKVLMIETSDVKPWLRDFNELGDKLSVDTVFFERYSEYQIREVPVHKFSEKLLWPFAQGFTHNYYTSIGNVLLIAEDLEELKTYLNDIDAEETWGRSVSQNRFLEATLLESNLSLYVNPGRFWNVYTPNFQTRWQKFIKERKKLLQTLQMSSIQFSHLNNSYYTNALFTFKPFDASSTQVKTPGNNVAVFEKGIQSLNTVRSHVNRSTEVLVQDSLNNLSLVSSDGRILWTVPINDRIVSEVVQVDFFNNGKLQYFFATQFSLHVIDRLGNYVNPYPVNLNSISVDQVSVVDYDNSKKYRFLVADKTGKIFMYDKEGNSLEGWNPNNAGGILSAPAKHYRIKGKDYIVASRKDGVINLWTRRGEILRKFPLNIEAEPVGDVFLERGSGLDDTYFVFVTRDGFRVRVTPEGKIQSKETLLKTSIRSTFWLTAEKSGKSYLVVQQDERQVTIADADGRKILSASVVGTGPGDVRYYDYGSGKIFITIKDKAQGLYFVYDGQGNLLTTPPVETPILEIRPLDSDEFTLFFVHGKSLVIQPL